MCQLLKERTNWFDVNPPRSRRTQAYDNPVEVGLVSFGSEVKVACKPSPLLEEFRTKVSAAAAAFMGRRGVIKDNLVHYFGRICFCTPFFGSSVLCTI